MDSSISSSSDLHRQSSYVGLRDWVLDNGPWHIQNKPLFLRSWSPEGLSYLASALGNPLYMDTITTSRERLEYVKVCVEIEAGVTIPESIQVILKDGSYVNVRVHVPWLPKFCAKCKTFGHHVNSCIDVRQPHQKSKEVQVWRKKDSKGTETVSKGSLHVTVITDTGTANAPIEISQSSTLPPDSICNPKGLLVGNTVERIVLALQENNMPNLMRKLSDASVSLELSDSVSTVHERVPTDGFIHTQSTDQSSDFPTLQDSLKKKQKGRKKRGYWFFNFWNVRGINNPRKQLKVLKRLFSCEVDIFCLMESRIRSVNSVSFTSALSDDWYFVGNYDFIEGGYWPLLLAGWGDFNIIAKAEESSDFDIMGIHCTLDMKDFQDCLEDLELMDHPFLGPLFTWSNKQEGSFLARKLDRILVNDQWMVDFPDSFVEFKAEGVSDHCLGMLWTHKGIMAKKPRPFKFYNIWSGHEKFLDVVRDSWQHQYGGDVMCCLFNKLKRLKHVLKQFNSKFFVDISGRVKAKRAKLEQIRIFNLAQFNQRRIEEEMKVHTDLVDLKVAEAAFYRQKAKVHWLREGDLNTKFFHQRVLSNKKKNSIRVIKSEDGCSAVALKDLLNYSLPEDADTLLTKDVTDLEIKEALFKQGVYKSPCPNGYTSGFFKSAWSIVGSDFIADVRILVNRLTPFFPGMISYNQSAFVKGKSIVDNTLLAQNIVKDYSRKGLSPRCVVKIDIHKYFDSINWDFLLTVFEAMGFSEVFCHWIRVCITTPKYYVCLNDSLVGYFKGARGIRQGDPLFPYLFVMVMNVLSAMLNKAAKHGIFKFHLKCRRISLTHLSFADDLLVFCHGSLESILGVQCILEGF
ncbi:uncharacterized protein LOC120130649 [Hibiscus syriacus]|uniref:uncharacterized protein LOC120130649 n=1 Tax=Hibiscus syriacus TaxID=106335 RepID=UPI00192247F6|nr:uncharacterized protein LOC120130649 [Hibiscus syriacus]